MARITRCPKCRAKYDTSRLPAGRRFACKKCGHPCAIPADTEDGISSEGVGSEPRCTPTPSPGGSDPAHRESLPHCLGGCRILRRLGQGGMGAVYLAHHERLDCEVAIKILPASLAERSESFIQRFVKEARLAARLRHPNVVQVLDVGTDQGYHYAIQEYVNGGSVRDRLNAEGVLPEDMVWTIATGIAQALALAEEHGIVHRDIKPDNIMFTQRGEVKLADLGLAKDLQTDVSTTGAGATLGTPLYMPPEQAADPQAADRRADFYALGATLYHLATGTPPFSGKNPFLVMEKHATEAVTPPRQHNRKLSAGLEDLILALLEKEPDKRPPDTAALIALLESTRSGKKPARRGRATRSVDPLLFGFTDEDEAAAALKTNKRKPH